MDFDAAYTLAVRNHPPFGMRSGNECCFGIDRGMHPHWAGWQVVDATKAEAPAGSLAFAGLLAEDVFLEARVRAFYAQLWEAMELESLGDPWALLVFDTALRFGARTALRLLDAGLDEVLASAGQGGTVANRAAALRSLSGVGRRLLLKEYLLARIFFHVPAVCQDAAGGIDLQERVAAVASLDRELGAALERSGG